MLRKVLLCSIVTISSFFVLASKSNVIVNNVSNTTTIRDASSSINTGINLGNKQAYGITGNGDMKNFKRKVTDFSKINIEVPFDVNVECGKPVSVSVSADSNIANFISTEISTNTLTIKTTKSFSTKNKICITICIDKIESIDTSSSGNITVSGITGSNFNLNPSGSSEIKLQGVIDEFDINSDGAATIDAKNLKADTVNIVMSGAGEASIFASKKLDVKIDGAADITYYGKPEKIIKNNFVAGSLEAGR